ncbi:hypothetical protein F0562_015418 [Nyssa sinensis]|uniref:Uncharacterized protein n=1 Tax=Nyssa sinensis TaxID=561372 RepID=A0A5J4ZJF7_9ASTE|nr:hypothetical protein F0562_015418 [Nyssa sinensis]
MAPKQTKRCVPHSRKTASDILKKGGDDVKYAWPLWVGPHTCYNGNYNGKQGSKSQHHGGPIDVDAAEEMEADVAEAGSVVPNDDYLVDQTPP